MSKVIEWIVSNKEWIFSGIGIAVISFIITLLIKRMRTSTSDGKNSINQTQKTAKKSTAFQAGGNIIIKTNKSSTAKKDADIRIVSVDVIDNLNEIKKFRADWLSNDSDHIKHEKFFPIIDIKLLNKGDEPAFLSHLEIEVELKKAFPDFPGHKEFPEFSSSWEYTVLLDPHAKNDKKKISISQKVPPNDIDRFVLVVGVDRDKARSALLWADYNIRLWINYNERNLLDLGWYSLKIHHIPKYFLLYDHVGIRHIPSK